MKHYLPNSLRALFLSLAVLLSLPMLAVKVEIDGINYELVSKVKQATVIAKSSGKYSGEVVIPESVVYEGTTYSVTSIGEFAFYECSDLTSVTIPNGMTCIGGGAFYRCYALTSVTIPSSVTSIESSVFWDCYGLTTITIPNSVTSIGDFAFYNCSGLTSVTIPNNITSIEASTFNGCSALTSLTIPNSVTSIGVGAFEGCSALTSIDIPDNVKNIGSYLFSGCSSLISVTIPNRIKSIGENTFSGCTSLTSINIPKSVISIEEYAFFSCSSLTSVTIPNNVMTIGKSAFNGCSGLVSLTIGMAIESIYNEAFANCPELLDVYSYAEKVPYAASNAFDGSYPEYVTLHVPDASVKSYKSTEPWSSFSKIVGLSAGEPEQPEVEKCATPVVTYAEGKLSFSCETTGAQFVTNITDTDIKKHYDAEIELSATYNIEVFATKANCENSDTVSVALVWVENGNVDEETGVISVPAAPVLVQGNGGVLNISGVAKNTDIVVYTVSGTEVARATAIEGTATISTGLQSGTIVVVKFGNKSVKVRI